MGLWTLPDGLLYKLLTGCRGHHNRPILCKDCYFGCCASPLVGLEKLTERIESSFIPGTSTACNLSGPSRPCTVGFIGSPKAPWIVTSDDADMSDIFHCSPTPLMPAPESKIRSDVCYLTDNSLTCWAISEFLLVLFVGVENLVVVSTPFHDWIMIDLDYILSFAQEH